MSNRSILPCPYGCTMNEVATPVMSGHMNFKLYGNKIMRFVSRYGVKKHRNIEEAVKWQNKFRKYKKTLC